MSTGSCFTVCAFSFAGASLGSTESLAAIAVDGCFGGFRMASGIAFPLFSHRRYAAKSNSSLVEPGNSVEVTSVVDVVVQDSSRTSPILFAKECTRTLVSP